MRIFLVSGLQLLYPGLCLADVTPGSYKIEEVRACPICGGVSESFSLVWL
jgi:hypothetical protein